MMRYHVIKACVAVSWEVAELLAGVNVRDDLKNNLHSRNLHKSGRSKLIFGMIFITKIALDL